MDFRSNTESQTPLVTIGVLSYNYGLYVIETLDSIYDQTYGHIQLIVIDDHSTDNSVDLIKEWINTKAVNCDLVVHEKNFGRNRACNTIIEKAKGKYLVLFSSDDIMFPGRIEAQVNEMENVGDEYGVCYTDAELMNERGEHRGFYSSTQKVNFLEGDVFEDYYNRRCLICAPCVFFRTKVFETIGSYDEKVTIEDYDMWMRLLPKFKVKFCSYVGIKYRIKENLIITKIQSLADKRYYHRNRLYIYAKLHKLLIAEKKWPAIKKDLVRKINYHLIHLEDISPTDFWKMSFYLVTNSFYKIDVVKLVKLHLKFFLVLYKLKATGVTS